MSKAVILMIGGEGPPATLEYPEYKKLPSEYILETARHIKETEAPIIRTMSGKIIHLVGELIFQKIIEPVGVVIMLNGISYFFDENGVVDGDWPYGVLDNWNEEEVLAIFSGQQ